MTQISRPQPGHQDSGYLDAGPYSADQWSELYKILFTGDNPTTQGPLTYVLNQLEATSPSVTTVQVDTGWGVCNGHLLKNSAAVTFTPSAPVGNSRIDVVVMVENNTAVARTQGIATPNNLIFPNDLTDYEGTASLKPYTCRLAILQGTPAGSPVAPTLDVDTATMYMVPLLQYTISTVPVIGTLVDLRQSVKSPLSQWLPMHRQGLGTVNWGTQGGASDIEIPLGVLYQVGTGGTTIGAGDLSAALSIVFPVAFDGTPVLSVTLDKTPYTPVGITLTEQLPGVIITALSATGFTCYVGRVNPASDSANVRTMGIHWTAFGPKGY